jgi:hypothetical protein
MPIIHDSLLSEHRRGDVRDDNLRADVRNVLEYSTEAVRARARRHHAHGRARPPGREPRRGVKLRYDEYLEVTRKAALANVTIYTIDPRGLRAAGNAAMASGLALPPHRTMTSRAVLRCSP